MAEQQRLRNVGIVAHVDAGKTTITSQMHCLCGEARAPGSVEGGTAQAHLVGYAVIKNSAISVSLAAKNLLQV